MKKIISLCAALALALSLSLTALAADDEEYAYIAADDYINLTEKSGDTITLFDTLYPGARGDCTIRVKMKYGDGLYISSVDGSVSAESRRLVPSKEPLHPEYEYYLLTITPLENSETDAPEKFSLRIRTGDRTVTLSGETAPAEEMMIFSGIRYTARDGVVYRFTDEIEETALVRCPDNLTVEFRGDYGETTVDLSVDHSDIQALGGVLPCWRFLDEPDFEENVTVRIRADEDTEIYEVLESGLYPVKTTYEDGQHVFETKVLTGYAVYQA